MVAANASTINGCDRRTEDVDLATLEVNVRNLLAVLERRRGETKGFEWMLTVKDIAKILGKTDRWVKDEMIKPKAVRWIKVGGNGHRVYPASFRAWLDKGATGFNSAEPSGFRRRKGEADEV